MFGTCATCGCLDLGKIHTYDDFNVRCSETGLSVYFSVASRRVPGAYKTEEKEQLAIEHLEELGVGCLKWRKDTDGMFEEYDGIFREEWVDFPKYKPGDTLRVKGNKVVRWFGQKVRIIDSRADGCNNEGMMCYVHYYKLI